ncbi:MAG TPA: hypothetical protein VGB53_05800 [Rubricoccaceae bacterium]|jgi:hypothetical protein
MPPYFTWPTRADLNLAETLVQEAWPSLAGFAWERYQAEGRGLVAYNSDQQKPSESGLTFPRFRYVIPKPGESFLRSIGFDISRMVAEYDPKTEVVLLFSRVYSEIDRKMRERWDSDETKVLPPIVTLGIYRFEPAPPLARGTYAN